MDWYAFTRVCERCCPQIEPLALRSLILVDAVVFFVLDADVKLVIQVVYLRRPQLFLVEVQ